MGASLLRCLTTGVFWVEQFNLRQLPQRLHAGHCRAKRPPPLL